MAPATRTLRVMSESPVPPPVMNRLYELPGFRAAITPPMPRERAIRHAFFLSRPFLLFRQARGGDVRPVHRRLPARRSRPRCRQAADVDPADRGSGTDRPLRSAGAVPAAGRRALTGWGNQAAAQDPMR
ncbi:MAG: hypothetical protein Kow0073_09550 [Immundisolibacter sp.]